MMHEKGDHFVSASMCKVFANVLEELSMFFDVLCHFENKNPILSCRNGRNLRYIKTRVVIRQAFYYYSERDMLSHQNFR